MDSPAASTSSKKATSNTAEEFSDEDWTWTIENNLAQVFYLDREAARHTIRQGTGGSIVALASVDGIAAAGYHSAYGAAKAGVSSSTKSGADDLGRDGIRVNAMAPGNLGTGSDDQTEDRWGADSANPPAGPRAKDIANAVLFWSSALAARITGQTLVLDAGATIKSLWGMTPDDVPALRRHSARRLPSRPRGAVAAARPRSGRPLPQEREGKWRARVVEGSRS